MGDKPENQLVQISDYSVAELAHDSTTRKADSRPIMQEGKLSHLVFGQSDFAEHFLKGIYEVR